jgi:hypothetical protein
MVLFVVLVLAYQFLVQGPLNGDAERAPRAHRGRASKTRTRPLPWPRPRPPSTPPSCARRAARSTRRARQRVKQWNAEREARSGCCPQGSPGSRWARPRPSSKPRLRRPPGNCGPPPEIWPARWCAPFCPKLPGVPLRNFDRAFAFCRSCFPVRIVRFAFWG